MEQNLNDMPLELPAKHFTLKILFGPMFGCELSLPADNYFIIIHPSTTQTMPTAGVHQELANTAAFAHNTLYIPCDEHSPNLILHLSDLIESEQGIGYQVDIHDSQGCDSQVVPENTLFRHEKICLAFKESNDVWAQPISSYNRVQPLPASYASFERVASYNKNKRRGLLAAGIFFLLLLSGGIAAWYKNYQYENQVVALNVALAGAPAPLKIIRAANKKVYVFANSHQEIAWLREVLYKLNDTSKIIPVWTTQIRKDIVRNLLKKGIPALQLDLNTPQHPLLITYQKLTPTQEDQIKQTLQQEIPYADNIDIVFQDKERLLKQARQGLERLHIPYRQINTDNGYALIVRDAISDNTLGTLRYFITDFYNQWGNQVINFSINLNENWLQDKSYLDAKGGYLFLNPLHWYFPLQHGEAKYG